MDQFLKDLAIYKLSQDLGLFEIGIGCYLSFRQQMFGDFNFRLRDAYLTEIDKVPKGMSRELIYFLRMTDDLHGTKNNQHSTPRSMVVGKREYKHWAIRIELYPIT